MASRLRQEFVSSIIKKDRRKSFFLLLGVFGFLVTCNLKITVENEDDTLNWDRNLALDGNQETNKIRPFIFTYYEPIPESERRTGMSEKMDQELIEAWKDAWYDAGWKPKVLTRKDAEQHPAYEKLNDLLQQYVKNDQSVFEQACFLRWLATAAAGGGWLCDYDVFPLYLTADKYPELPSDGKFTAHDGPVPSLLSGSHKEWDRVSRHLIEIATGELAKYGDGNNHIYISDMYALEYIIKHEKDMVVMRREVSRDIALGKNGKVDCREMTGQLAAHFSHKRMIEAWIKGYSMPEILMKRDIAGHRAIYAPKFRNSWKSQCPQNN